MNYGLGYSEFSEKVYIGKQEDMGNGHGKFVGEKRDYTNEFLHVVEQYFPVGTSRVIGKGDTETMYISIENTNEAKLRLIESLQKEVEGV